MICKCASFEHVIAHVPPPLLVVSNLLLHQVVARLLPGSILVSVPVVSGSALFSSLEGPSDCLMLVVVLSLTATWLVTVE